MKAKQLLLVLLLSISMTGFCATIEINASDADMSFSPDNVIINSGDVVRFILGSIHNAVEVSESTWNSNGTAPLLGGFLVSDGQTQDVMNLSVGTHWYVCTNHASMGMKGMITVTALGINDFQLVNNFSVFPNPTTDFVNIRMINSSFGESYRIMDQGGRFVFDGKLEDVTTAVDLSQFASGIYFLQIGTETRRTFKLVKN